MRDTVSITPGNNNLFFRFETADIFFFKEKIMALRCYKVVSCGMRFFFKSISLDSSLCYRSFIILVFVLDIFMGFFKEDDLIRRFCERFVNLYDSFVLKIDNFSV